MGSYGFRADRLERLAEIERSHFWFVARRSLIRHLIERYAQATPRTIVDVGCGTGFTLDVVARENDLAVGIDRRPERLGRSSAGTDINADVTALPLADGCADVVLALDVLEHVDDRAALHEIRRVLRPGGILVATVPAFMFLWSFRDEDAGHRRRYRRGGFREVMRAARLDVRLLTYYQFWLFPLMLATRWIARLLPRARDVEEARIPLLNGLLTTVLCSEVILIRMGVRFPWGSSLVTVARTPDPEHP